MVLSDTRQHFSPRKKVIVFLVVCLASEKINVGGYGRIGHLHRNPDAQNLSWSPKLQAR